MDLTPAQAALLRQYQRRILKTLDLREKLYCEHCAEAGRLDGVKAFVTASAIEIRCRCTHRIFTGPSL